MSSYQTQLIELALRHKVLRFGQFTLKSGRMSPYFFNSGLFYTAEALATLGKLYAEAIIKHQLAFDGLFGAAYKGIPLACSTAVALFQKHSMNVPYTFNRKEAKTHGEGGELVGSPLSGRILLIDDVMTAGTAIREALSILKNHDATPAGLVLLLDRQEKGTAHRSAVQEIQEDYHMPVVSLITLKDIIEHLENTGETTQLKALQAYQQQYGV